jgi:hypothetical protein
MLQAANDKNPRLIGAQLPHALSVRRRLHADSRKSPDHLAKKTRQEPVALLRTRRQTAAQQ